jgi:hypothetical protein
MQVDCEKYTYEHTNCNNYLKELNIQITYKMLNPKQG